MRLTLRTLLAYLDDTLAADAARDIGQKLNESETAQELAARIREVTRRRRIAAPDLDADRLDPNEVAEYLDNLLSPEQTTEVEQVCLAEGSQGDMYLAEVAGCHQILTMMGQRAAVSDSMRERMYALVPSIESEPAARWLSRVRRAAAERGQRGRTLARLAGTLVGLAVVVLVGLLAWRSLPGRWVQPQVGGQPKATKPDIFRPDVLPDDVKPGGGPQRSGTGAEPALPAGRRAEPPGQAAAGPAPVAKPAPAPGAAAEAMPAAGARQQPAEPPTGGPDAKPAAQRPIPQPGAKPAPKKATPAQPAPQPAAAAPAKPAAAEPAKPAAKPTKPAPEPVAKQSPPAPPIGLYNSTSGVLLRAAAEGERAWKRLPPKTDDQAAQLHAGDRLLCLPTFRASLRLGQAHLVELVGETEVTLAAPAAKDGPDVHLRLHRGRLVLATAAQQATFQIDLLDQSWQLTLKGAESIAGLELVARWVPGGGGEYQAAVYLPEGEAELVTPDQSHQLGAPVELPWSQADGFAEGRTLSARPAWIDRQELPVLVARASQRIEAALAADRPVSLTLTEAVSDEHRQVRLLAVRCLGAIRFLDPLVEALGDIEHREVRREAIAVLRSYISHGLDRGQRLKEALVRVRHGSEADADGMLALLRGFGEQEWRNPDTYRLLIDLLDGRDLAIRELAIENLSELTGEDLNYSPDRPNQRQILSWQRLLEQGRLPPRARGKL